MARNGIEEGIRHIKRVDPRLAKVIRYSKSKPRVVHRGKPLEALYTAIISQQISGAAADTIQKRFYALYGNAAPTPKQLLSTHARKLRSCGLSRQKVSYLRDLASKASNYSIRINEMAHLTDQQVMEELTSIKGIGRWTAEMFLIFNLGRLDVFPVGDLGIRRGMTRLYDLDPKTPEEELTRIAEKWRPYRSVGSWYIWQTHDK
jgi:DNA-3-methyladenine glycosylase II